MVIAEYPIVQKHITTEQMNGVNHINSFIDKQIKLEISLKSS